MSTKRKTTARSSRTARRAKPARAEGRSRTAATRKSAAKPAAKGKSAPKVAAKARSGAAAKSIRQASKDGSKKSTVAASKTGAKTAVAVAQRNLKAVDSSSRSVVRPLGVLPPQHHARSTHRPAPMAAIRPRPASLAPATPQEITPVTEPDLKEFEARLLEERRRILKEMGHLETTVLKVNPRDSAGDLSGYSFHMADAGTDAMEREKAFLFASTEGRALMEINDALRRMYRGEYGVCESCGQPIPRGRLEAVPHARLCIACKEKEERSKRGTT